MDRRRALASVTKNGSSDVPTYDGFPLYVTADESIKDELFGYLTFYSYADYSELYEYLMQIIISHGDELTDGYYCLENPEDYGIEIYLDTDGTWARINAIECWIDDGVIGGTHNGYSSFYGIMITSNEINWEYFEG